MAELPPAPALRPEHARVLALQRAAGNRATAQLLAATDPAAVQRVKSVQERAAKQRRVYLARKEIPPLAGSVSAKLRDHIFKALPMTGALDKNDPQGLHAYDGGALPAGVRVDSVDGSPTKVHGLNWHWDGGAATPKFSTMMPTWMPRSHVLALVALRLGTATANKSAVETYIKRGLAITMDKSGDTVYPT